MWKVNAGRRSKYAQDFADRALVAIGWHQVGDPTRFATKADLVEAVAAAYPDWSLRQAEVGASQIWRFLHEVQEGDAVITYDPVDRVYLVGTVRGPAVYDPNGLDELPTTRAVQWEGRASRDALSEVARNALGAILTLFRVRPEVAAEVTRIGRGEGAPVSPQPVVAAEDGDDPFEDLEEQALERIKDRLMELSWDDMQEIVAALLRALGYRTIVSAAGPDRGKDILASRDGFGFESPRIVVEVKHRKGAMGAPEIRAFGGGVLGGRHSGDRGLYVSTGGFTREAYYEAERATTVTHLMTLDGLARALVANYESVDEKGRALLPLTRLYWLA